LIRLFSIQSSERLQYIAKIIFETLLGVEYEIVKTDESFDEAIIHKSGIPALLYGIPSDILPCIPDDGLLFENDIVSKEFFIKEGEITKVCLSDNRHQGYTIDFDIFSAAFYLITQYQEYNSLDIDEHGRYIESGNILYKNGLHKRPLVDIYSEFIWQKLKSKYPTLVRKEQKFDFKITFDIDSPYLFKNKSVLVTAGSLLKNSLKFNFNNVFQQIKVLIGGNDPYDVFDEIIKATEISKLLFFFLIDRHHKHDSRFSFNNKAYRRLIKRIADAGIEIGIHPSYTSFKKSDQIRFEKKQLELIAGKQVLNSRMHFLKYALPETFEHLVNAGMENDYTLCPLNSTGFKNFISRPFYWFNLRTNAISSLIIHPTMVMDRALQKYMKLSPDEAWIQIKNTIDITNEYNGSFSILFHNSTLSETGEWKRWKTVYEKTIQYLTALSVNINSSQMSQF